MACLRGHKVAITAQLIKAAGICPAYLIWDIIADKLHPIAVVSKAVQAQKLGNAAYGAGAMALQPDLLPQRDMDSVVSVGRRLQHALLRLQSLPHMGQVRNTACSLTFLVMPPTYKVECLLHSLVRR